MGKTLMIRIIVAITFVAMIIVNFLSTTLPINNISPGEVSDSYPNLFAPAGITFSIWGIIYLLLAVYTIHQLFFVNKSSENIKLFERIGIYFSVSSLANMAWIFSWHYNYIVLSLTLMVTILFCLIKIADIINNENLEKKEKFIIASPFTIYFGWITVATIANVTTLLVSLNWDGFGIQEKLWTILVIIIGTVIGLMRLKKDKRPLYGLVFVWAYYGIFLKHKSVTGFNNMYPEIILTSLLCAVIFLTVSGYVLFKNKSIK